MIHSLPLCSESAPAIRKTAGSAAETAQAAQPT